MLFEEDIRELLFLGAGTDFEICLKMKPKAVKMIRNRSRQNEAAMFISVLCIKKKDICGALPGSEALYNTGTTFYRDLAGLDIWPSPR